MPNCWVVVVVVTWYVTSLGEATRDGFHAKRLYDDMLRKGDYNRVIRPVSNVSDSLPVRVGLRLTSIIDVVSTSASLIQCLFTYLLQWRFYVWARGPVDTGPQACRHRPPTGPQIPNLANTPNF